MIEALLSYLKAQAGIILPALAGVGVTLLTTERRSLMGAVARVACGLFCAVALTDPVLIWMHWDSDVFRSAVSGILAINGFQLVKFLGALDADKLIDLARKLRGK